jgi:hypothetical protein
MGIEHGFERHAERAGNGTAEIDGQAGETAVGVSDRQRPFVPVHSHAEFTSQCDLAIHAGLTMDCAASKKSGDNDRLQYRSHDISSSCIQRDGGSNASPFRQYRLKILQYCVVPCQIWSTTRPSLKVSVRYRDHATGRSPRADRECKAAR